MSNLTKVSDEILNKLLEYREDNPELTFNLRSVDKNKRLSKGQWFQGSHYIYVGLFKLGDKARRIKTIGFALNFKNDQLDSNYIEVSFKQGSFDDYDRAFHKDVAELVGINLNSENHGAVSFQDKDSYIDNLNSFIHEKLPSIIELLDKYDLRSKYLIKENEFNKKLNKIKEIKSSMRFKEAVTDFINNLGDDSILNSLGFGDIKAKYVWIGDQSGYIGNQECHYEFQLCSNNMIDVVIHFEGQERKYLIEQLGELDDKLLHNSNRLKEVIRFRDKVSMDSTGFIDSLKERLKYIEINYGDKLRKILQDAEEHTESINKPLNQIIFGPPGTGKTYNTINKAISIINPEFDLTQDRGLIKAEYDKLVNEGRILFTTFHQSMSYEDFIEGIKPQEPKDEDTFLTYTVEPGIFKRACIEASFSIAKESLSTAVKDVFGISEIFENLISEIQEEIDAGKTYTFDTKKGGVMIVDEISDKGNIRVYHKDKDRKYTVSKDRISKLYKVFKDLDLVQNIDKEFREVIGGSNSSAYWSVLNKIIKETKQQNISTITTDRSHKFEDKISAVESLNKEDYRVNKQKPYVIIIDEINRGNVSSIFGELITLIEEDKRLGNDESLTIKLPYSKTDFGVPPNLYILGTMNTADRSVEALDSALRRRFQFVEMPPNSELIEEVNNNNGEVSGYSLIEMLDTINERIEVLLDRDHLIGHSYFLKINSLNQLKVAFSKQILPLLQEYFFGDYGKISLVLGEGFCQSEEKDISRIFAKSSYDSSPFEGRVVYTIVDPLTMDNQDFDSAIKKLLNNGNTSEELDIEEAED